MTGQLADLLSFQRIAGIPLDTLRILNRARPEMSIGKR